MDIEQQETLKEITGDQEKQLAILTTKLNELNIALRVFGDAWGKEKAAIDNRVKNFLDSNVFPFIEKMKTSNKCGDIQTYIKIIEDNLKNIGMVISGGRNNTIETFTPLESQVFQLVRQGKSSKEIAEILNLSIKAISFHRSNIRKKLNLVNKKINLVNYVRNQEILKGHYD